MFRTHGLRNLDHDEGELRCYRNSIMLLPLNTTSSSAEAVDRSIRGKDTKSPGLGCSDERMWYVVVLTS